LTRLANEVPPDKSGGNRLVIPNGAGTSSRFHPVARKGSNKLDYPLNKDLIVLIRKEGYIY